MNTTRPQNLELIYEALANSGEVGEGDNRNDANKINIIQTDIKSEVVPVVLELQ